MKKGKILIIIGLILLAIGLLLIGKIIYETKKAEQIANETTEKIKEEIKEVENIKIDDIPDYKKNPNIEMPVATIDGKDYVGYLYIERLDVELPVLTEWDTKSMSPAKYNGTAYLPNFVICAHNYYKHFGKLKNLKPGDLIVFTDMDGNIFHYQVAEIVNTLPTEVEEMKNNGWDLTLFTCTVSATKRVTVHCEKIED